MVKAKKAAQEEEVNASRAKKMTHNSLCSVFIFTKNLKIL